MVQGIPANMSAGSVLFQFNVSMMQDSMNQMESNVQQMMAPIAGYVHPCAPASGSTIDISV
jgi:hypothetical protein